MKTTMTRTVSVVVDEIECLDLLDSQKTYDQRSLIVQIEAMQTKVPE